MLTKAVVGRMIWQPPPRLAGLGLRVNSNIKRSTIDECVPAPPAWIFWSRIAVTDVSSRRVPPDRRRVLIIEDELATLYAINHLFLGSGWDVQISKSAKEALSDLDPIPDWVIIDLGLADSNGLDLLRYIRRNSLPCRVVLIVEQVDKDLAATLEPLKPEAVLKKPLSFDRLAQVCEAGPITPEQPHIFEFD